MVKVEIRLTRFRFVVPWNIKFRFFKLYDVAFDTI